MKSSSMTTPVTNSADGALFALLAAYAENKRKYAEMTDEQEGGTYGESVDAEFDRLSERLATWDLPLESIAGAVAALRFVFDQDGAIACGWSEALLRGVLGFLESLPEGAALNA